MPEIIGLTTAKLNGIFEVDVKNARWDLAKATPQSVTPAGIRTAEGAEMPSGSFDEVIPKQGATNWRALKSFSIEILDQETRSITIASFTGCHWNRLSGSSDLQSAVTGKSVSWVGESVAALL